MVTVLERTPNIRPYVCAECGSSELETIPVANDSGMIEEVCTDCGLVVNRKPIYGNPSTAESMRTKPTSQICFGNGLGDTLPANCIPKVISSNGKTLEDIGLRCRIIRIVLAQVSESEGAYMLSWLRTGSEISKRLGFDVEDGENRTNLVNLIGDDYGKIIRIVAKYYRSTGLRAPRKRVLQAAFFLVLLKYFGERIIPRLDGKLFFKAEDLQLVKDAIQLQDQNNLKAVRE
jgi:hypothetical protein